MNLLLASAKRIACLVAFAGLAMSLGARADDIDIYQGLSGGSAAAPNIIFLIDNSPNWSRASQHWPDNGGNQGQAELAAVSSVLNKITATRPANVGLAMLSSNSGAANTNGIVSTPGTGGGYIRFGVRDMTNVVNKLALQAILTGISANINSPSEKLQGMASKDEDAGFYEIYKYLSGLQPFTGDEVNNPNADVAHNGGLYTAAGQGLNSGWAIDHGSYESPIVQGGSCAATYIIYIANNANNTGASGNQFYQQSVADTGAALPATPGLDTRTDEWTKFLHTSGVTVPSGNNNGQVVTYVLDAFSAQQNVGYSNSLQNAAKMGGGKYFQVGTQIAIYTALAQILSEIEAVNSTFASASLPVNATNRSQNKNQVFIPMFRPDQNGNPRWMGNLKEFQLVNFSGSTDLGDSESPSVQAVNPLTGFITPCAISFWTQPDGNYWLNVIQQPMAKGSCAAVSGVSWNDDPDGAIVEKGGVGEVIRLGNNPPSTSTTPTWNVNRTVLTMNNGGANFINFTAASTGLPATLVNFMVGQDVNDENNNANTTEVRPSVHGDAVHSRPLPVDYGSGNGVTVFYGSNDGTLRAVNAGTSITDPAAGAERWAFIPPEFYTPAPAAPPATPTGFERLMYSNSSIVADPLILYPNTPAGIVPAPAPKDYYWDGSIGLYQTLNSAKVWIYPSMRRGGRTVYALDVSNPNNPKFMWKFGCPNLANDTGCSAGSSAIGQTWSLPLAVTTVNGYATGPVIIMGGGYDGCEDANLVAPACGSPKGAVVYVLDATSGAIIKSFTTTRSVAADVALIGIANPAIVDHAYVADTGGNIYRIDFTGAVGTWAMNRVAYTNGSGRKFLFPPALLGTMSNGGKVYVALGSGDREHPLISEYPYANVTNRFYVYVDSLGTTTATNLDDTGSMYDYSAATGCNAPGALPSSTIKGWFMNLNANGPGEQVVTSALIAAGIVFFSTNQPVPSSAGTCQTTLGIARGYALNLFNGSGAIGAPGASCGGSRSASFVGGGLPPSPILATVPVSNADGTNTQMETIVIGGAQLTGTTSSAIQSQQVKPSIVPVRNPIYWKSSGEN